MKRIFLDTNVVIDFLCKREPFYKDSVDILMLAYHHKIILYTSSITFSTASYLLRKKEYNEMLMLLRNLRTLIKVATVDEKVVDSSLISEFNDFEDSLQYYSSLRMKCECIITRNGKDFLSSEISVMSPTEFLQDY
jgi:predicted nucleic acid-binding protein